MGIIYKPQGKAKEYSPYALNIYIGCDYACRYCYIKNLYVNNEKVKLRENLISGLENQLKKQEINKQVLLSFLGDPYCIADIEYKKTRETLEILNQYDVPVAILSKGGNRILRDLDLFKKFKKIKVGATLTLLDKKQNEYYEPKAASTGERICVLRKLHQEGIRTWVSFEPVIDPEQTLKILELTKDFVDEFKVGKMNYFQLPQSINWGIFGESISKRLLEIQKDFYIKKDLYKYMDYKLQPKYIDQDYLALKDDTETIKEKDIEQQILF
jgi:DNA repair photolyase